MYLIKMDPYELFSTPPNEIIFSSTPRKATRNRKGEGGENLVKKRSAKPRASQSFDSGIKPSKPNKPDKGNISTTTRSKAGKRSKKQAANLWDKCLKTNPELAEFVDNFNQSLEEATKKPLDMTSN